MQITNKHCDVCGIKDALSLKFDYERVNDGNGHYDTESKTIDLCHEHTRVRLQMLLQEPPAAPASSGKEEFSRWAKQQDWKPKA